MTEKLLVSQEGICSMECLRYSLRCWTGSKTLNDIGRERKYTLLTFKFEVVNLAFGKV
jgi:hypothetical protein